MNSAKAFASKLVDEKGLIPPIDPLALIKERGVEVLEEKNQYGIEAYSYLGKSLKIVINPEFNFMPRRRFTLAHELGHIYIPWHNGDTKCDTDKPYNIINGVKYLDIQELEANIFASELLMPTKWLILQYEAENFNLRTTIEHVQSIAKTSIMACLYALERSLTSGHIFYVKKEFSDYWKEFASERTHITRVFYYYEEEMSLLDKICISKVEFNISQYNVIHYTLTPCLKKENIIEIYNESGGNIVETLLVLSEYNMKNILLSLNSIFDSINDVYLAILFFGDRFIKIISGNSSLLNCYSLSYSKIIELFICDQVNFKVMEIGLDFTLLIVSEEFYEFVLRDRTEPNTLLKQIVSDLYPETEKMNKLRSINGIVSNINGSNKNSSRDILYNKMKYRFIDLDWIELFNHKDFDIYLVNKIEAMLSKRKCK